MPNLVHAPLEVFPPNPDDKVIDCICGWHGVPWSTDQGAQRRWLQHVVDEMGKALPSCQAQFDWQVVVVD